MSPAAFAVAQPGVTGAQAVPVPAPPPSLSIPPGMQSPAAFAFAAPRVPVQPGNTDAFLVFFP
jgi:hypothetical protein